MIIVGLALSVVGGALIGYKHRGLWRTIAGVTIYTIGCYVYWNAL